MTDYDPEKWLASEMRAENEASREVADNDGASWTADEDAFLVAEWLAHPRAERDEFEIAAILGRTVVACRVRATYLRSGVRAPKRGTRQPRKRVTETTTKTTTRTTEYLGYYDDPEEQWWK